MIRLFVIEDHITVIVSSLRYLFRPNRDGIIVSGYATTVEDAIKSADPGSLDLFVLDLYLPGHQPIDNIRNLKKHFPDKPIAIYTSEPSASWKKRMMDEGALTYITKNSSRDELKLALQKAARGELFYYGQFGSTDQKSTGDEPSSEMITITPVQQEIVKLLSEGLTHKEISDRSGISRPMIEKILRNLRKSFKANNNLELMKVLIRSGSI
jgi:DNA-binding NarL/FixJ family response regulator